MALPALGDFLPDTPGADELLDALIEWSARSGLELYPHQEEAVLRLLAGENVVLSTPTGSGKSLVALAGAFAMLAQGRRAVYTAPIKALVSEKFFELTAAFGPSAVGMVTGDASVNADAPVIACTAEILAQRALRAGSDTAADLVVMDEFHYYGDRDRGWAWQVPLLELPGSRFLLMSATLGDTTGLRRDLTARTGRDTALVASAERPVPLDMEYRETPLHVSIEQLLSAGQAPVYIVHFTQREATARAQSLTSLKVLSADEKAAVKEAVGGFRFDTPIGKDLRRFVLAGIGVHHAGMLPKYRLLVEKLAQQGHLKLICGTDTLGVGVNVPIRTVLFTQLYKYDGRRTRVLSVRDFQQIAGRAGRRGFDTVGSVWVQAPEHAVENKRAEMRAAGDPKKLRKLVRKKPPDRGYAHYDDKTLTRLWEGTPETLESSFDVTHSMMLNVLDRRGDGCAAMKRLLVDNHEPRSRQRRHIRKAVGVFRSLIDAEIVEVLPEPDESGRPVRVNIDLQDEFRLNQPLGLFAVEAVSVLDRGGSRLPPAGAQRDRIGAGRPAGGAAGPAGCGPRRADDPHEGGGRGVRGADGPAGRGDLAQARGRVHRARLRHLRPPSPVGRASAAQPQVGGARHGRARRHLQPVREPLRAQALRGAGAALPHRLLQGAGADRAGGRGRRPSGRGDRVAGEAGAPSRQQPAGRMGAPARCLGSSPP